MAALSRRLFKQFHLREHRRRSKKRIARRDKKTNMRIRLLVSTGRERYSKLVSSSKQVLQQEERALATMADRHQREEAALSSLHGDQFRALDEKLTLEKARIFACIQSNEDSHDRKIYSFFQRRNWFPSKMLIMKYFPKHQQYQRQRKRVEHQYRSLLKYKNTNDQATVDELCAKHATELAAMTEVVSLAERDLACHKAGSDYFEYLCQYRPRQLLQYRECDVFASDEEKQKQAQQKVKDNMQMQQQLPQPHIWQPQPQHPQQQHTDTCTHACTAANDGGEEEVKENGSGLWSLVGAVITLGRLRPLRRRKQVSKTSTTAAVAERTQTIEVGEADAMISTATSIEQPESTVVTEDTTTEITVSQAIDAAGTPMLMLMPEAAVGVKVLNARTISPMLQNEYASQQELMGKHTRGPLRRTLSSYVVPTRDYIGHRPLSNMFKPTLCTIQAVTRSAPAHTRAMARVQVPRAPFDPCEMKEWSRDFDASFARNMAC